MSAGTGVGTTRANLSSDVTRRAVPARGTQPRSRPQRLGRVYSEGEAIRQLGGSLPVGSSSRRGESVSGRGDIA